MCELHAELCIVVMALVYSCCIYCTLRVRCFIRR